MTYTESLPTPELTPSCRHNGWTAERQRRFCEVLSDCGQVEVAAKAVGLSREGAYRLRRRAAGKAFAMAWDAALYLARQRLIDESFDLAFRGNVTRKYRDGKLEEEVYRRDARAVLATVERLGGKAALGTAPVKAIAQEFEEFLNCLETDWAGGPDGSEGARFFSFREDQAEFTGRKDMGKATYLLARAQNWIPNTREETLLIEDNGQDKNIDSV